MATAVAQTPVSWGLISVTGPYNLQWIQYRLDWECCTNSIRLSMAVLLEGTIIFLSNQALFPFLPLCCVLFLNDYLLPHSLCGAGKANLHQPFPALIDDLGWHQVILPALPLRLICRLLRPFSVFSMVPSLCLCFSGEAKIWWNQAFFLSTLTSIYRLLKFCATQSAIFSPSCSTQTHLHQSLPDTGDEHGWHQQSSPRCKPH